MASKIKYIRVGLPEKLLKVLDIIRVDAPRSDIINYFTTGYIEEHLDNRLMLTEAEKKKIRKLLDKARQES